MTRTDTRTAIGAAALLAVFLCGLAGGFPAAARPGPSTPDLGLSARRAAMLFAPLCDVSKVRETVITIIIRDRRGRVKTVIRQVYRGCG